MPTQNETTKERLTGIPGDQVDKVVASYTAEGAIEVSKIQEPDGTWTVEVVLPQ